jgi:hypothetical protein
MSEENYTLKEMLTEMRIDMREHNDRAIRMEETLLATLEQAKKTNGRVTLLEINDEKQDRKLNRFQTIVATVGSIVGMAWAGITFIF